MMPCASQVGYKAATESEEVLSTNITRSLSWETRVVSRVVRLWRSAGREDEDRRDFHSFLSWGAEDEDELGSRVSVRVEEVKEMSLSGEGDGIERS